MNTLKFNQIEFNNIGEQPTSNIKLQEKSVTITENGTTEVVPDSGYALEKVEVKTNITNDPNSENYIEFFDWNTFHEYMGDDYAIANQGDVVFKLRKSSKIYIVKNASLSEDTILAVGVRPNFKISQLAIVNGEIGEAVTTFKQVLISLETYDTYQTIPRITKEEFYNLNV